MDHKQKLDELHKEMTEKLSEYVKTKGAAMAEDAQLKEAEHNWQKAWLKLQEVLMVLERLEI